MFKFILLGIELLPKLVHRFPRPELNTPLRGLQPCTNTTRFVGRWRANPVKLDDKLIPLGRQYPERIPLPDTQFLKTLG